MYCLCVCIVRRSLLLSEILILLCPIGGGLFAYSSQAVGNVMATGTGSYTNQSIGTIGSYGSQGGVVINSRYNPSTPAPTYGIYQTGYIQ